MARQARRESGTGYYHVMLRGINRELLFRRDADKQQFMEFVKEQNVDKLLELVAWCVMDNHVHMLVKAEIADMSKAIKIISLKFAGHYNRIQKRIGPVFGDRYRSENIENEAYLLGVLRYIHRNPVKAKIVGDAADYRWSSYAEYLNGAKYTDNSQKGFILGLFNEDLRRFAEFHVQDDVTQYLEINEDIEKNREELAEKIIESFCNDMGITSSKEIRSRPEHFTELCKLLVQRGFSLRKTAKYLETTHGRVYEALREQDDE